MSASSLILVTLLGTSSLPGYSLPRYGGDVVAPFPSRPRTYDPVRAERLGEWQLAIALFDGLMRPSTSGRKAELHLAREFKPVAWNGKRMLAELRRGVITHSGKRLFAADVVASLKRLKRSRQGWLLGALRSLRAVGRYRIIFELHRRATDLALVLASAPALVTPGGLAPGTTPDGTGPFRFVSGRLKREVRLAAFDQHFAGRPFVDKLRLVSYRRRIDELTDYYLKRTLVSFQDPSLLAARRLRISFPRRPLRARPLTTVALRPSNQGALSDRRVRQAIYYAVDKRRLRQLVTGSPTAPAHGPAPPALLGRRSRALHRRSAPRDKARARRLMRAASTNPQVAARIGRDGKLALSLLVDRSQPGDLDTARKMMADLQTADIRLTITALGGSAFAKQRHSGGYDLALVRFVSPVLRTRYHLAAALAAAGQRQAARKIIGARWLRLGKRLRRFMVDLPLIPLFHVGVRADVVSRLGYLKQGPWGLLRWEAAHFSSVDRRPDTTRRTASLLRPCHRRHRRHRCHRRHGRHRVGS